MSKADVYIEGIGFVGTAEDVVIECDVGPGKLGYKFGGNYKAFIQISGLDSSLLEDARVTGYLEGYDAGWEDCGDFYRDRPL